VYSINATFVTSCNTTKVRTLDVIVPRPSTNINAKRISITRIYFAFFWESKNDRLNEFVMLIYIYNNAMRCCNERTTLHGVESYLYYAILVNKKIFSEEWNEGEKIDNIIIYIVENIKFIYTIFDEFFLPVSQRVEMDYIFSDNVRILYLSCYFKSPKETVKLSKKSRNKRCSNRFWLCPLRSPRL
jgi:hypothetical protein